MITTRVPTYAQQGKKENSYYRILQEGEHE